MSVLLNRIQGAKAKMATMPIMQGNAPVLTVPGTITPPTNVQALTASGAPTSYIPQTLPAEWNPNEAQELENVTVTAKKSQSGFLQKYGLYLAIGVAVVVMYAVYKKKKR